MACVKKIIMFSPSHQSCRLISLSAWCFKRKPDPVRDPTKRNFQGEQLEEYMRKRAAAIEALKPYQNAVSEVIGRYTLEMEENERLKSDIKGKVMKRELAEREQALKNLTIIAKNNDELRHQRENQNAIDEEAARRKREEEFEQKKLLAEETRRRNTELVLRVIEESKEFITLENMDEKIDEALENIVNFNYAITSAGNKIYSKKPPGNLDGYKGASPTAYIAGGLRPNSEEWSLAFKDRDTEFALKTFLKEKKQQQRSTEST